MEQQAARGTHTVTLQDRYMNLEKGGADQGGRGCTHVLQVIRTVRDAAGTVDVYGESDRGPGWGVQKFLAAHLSR